MKLPRLLFISLSTSLIVLVLSVSAPAQRIIGAKAGIVQYVIGQAFLDDKPFRIPRGSYTQMENGQVLSTEKGRAEILLAPGVFLRLGENSSLLMEQNRLDATQLVVNRGVALIEVAETIKANPISLRISSSVIKIKKAGLYRLNTDPSELRVYGGAVSVFKENNKITVKEGRSIPLNGNFAPLKFDTRVVDVLYVWSGCRSFTLFVANPNNKELPNWKLSAKGDLKNSNYRLRFQTNAPWVKNWQIQEEKMQRFGEASQAAIVQQAIERAEWSRQEELYRQGLQELQERKAIELQAK